METNLRGGSAALIYWIEQNNRSIIQTNVNSADKLAAAATAAAAAAAAAA